MTNRVLLALLLACLPVAASAVCAPAQAGTPAFESAARQIQQLPELNAWSRSQPFPVAYDSSAEPLVRKGRCYQAIAVYANRPERLEVWHLFYVNAANRSVLIQEPVTGEVIPLNQWRSRQRPSAQQAR